MIRSVTLPSSIWQRELSEFVQRPRVLVIRLLLPLAVIAPLLHGPRGRELAPMALTVVLALLGSVTTSMTLVRERRSRLALRYRLLPDSPTRVGAELLLARAGLRAVQAAPALVMVLASGAQGVAWWPALGLGTAATLVAGVVFAAAVSTVTRSRGRAMVLTLVPVAAALALAGAFAPLLPALRPATFLVPFAYAHAALTGTLGASAGMAPAEAAAGAAVWLLVCLALVPRVGRRLVETS